MSGQKTKQKIPVSSKKTTAAIKVSSQPNNNKLSQRIIQNFLLIWLDSSIDESDDGCQKTLKQFRSIVNTIKIFTDPDQCIHFLNQINHEKIFMIVSGALGQLLVPNIHQKPQLDTVYIFCSNKIRHEQWIKEWPKIKGVHTQTNSIFEALRQAVKQCNQDSIPVSFVSTGDDISSRNLDQLEPSFMYTQIFKEILFELEYDEQSIKDSVNYCREQYVGNLNELDIINQFSRDYRPDTSIWWYTRECFTYQMLNRALRTLESDTIMMMGFFIRDLHHLIEKLYSEQLSGYHGKVFVVYRGQGLSTEDFKKLEQTKGGLISFNNFLSTSKKQEVSLGFAKGALAKPETVGILFKMTVDPSTSSTPFALIDNVSYFDAEQEVLFSMHTVFRIGEIKRIENNSRLYQVMLQLTGNNDQQLQTLTEQIRKETFPMAKGWYRMGKLLLKLGQFDKAEQVYSTILQQTIDANDRADIYSQLGQIKNSQGDYEKAISFYEKALDIDQKNLPSDHLSLANTYNNIGSVYDNLKDYPQARLYYEKALEIQKKTLPSNHPDLATSYNNIGLLNYNMEEYPQALSFYQKALAIKEETLPPNHPLLATSYNNIASVYYDMKDYPKALFFYEKTIEIEQKTLPPNHPDLATTYNNIGWIFREMKNYSKALSFFERAFDIKQPLLPPNHPSLQDMRQSIEFVKKKL